MLPCRGAMGARFNRAPKPEAVVPFGLRTWTLVVAFVRLRIVGVPPTAAAPVPTLAMKARLKMLLNSPRILKLILSANRKVRPIFRFS